MINFVFSEKRGDFFVLRGFYWWKRGKEGRVMGGEISMVCMVCMV